MLMMKQLATGLVPYEIHSNVLCPGLSPSDKAAPILAATENVLPKTLVPAERPGTQEEMAGAILFLASLAGGYCHGNVLLTDGGRLSVMPRTY
jgi:NAD(P)-dependent dehydrogenase (short-subunit alcohol dehydrogenase family)